MSTYSNVPVLDGIATAIHPDLNNYANGRDYYGSPVHTALERELNDHSWPWVRREYLLNEKGRETKFPHNNKKLPDTCKGKYVVFLQKKSLISWNIRHLGG